MERTVADADRARSMVAKLREPEFGVSSAETLKRLKKDDLMAAGFSRGEANVLIEKLGGRDARAAVLCRRLFSVGLLQQRCASVWSLSEPDNFLFRWLLLSMSAAFDATSSAGAVVSSAAALRSRGP